MLGSGTGQEECVGVHRCTRSTKSRWVHGGAHLATDFLEKLTRKIPNGNHMIAGVFGKLVVSATAKLPDYDQIIAWVLQQRPVVSLFI